MNDFDNMISLAEQVSHDFGFAEMSENLEQESRRYSRRLTEEEEARLK